MKIVYKFEMKHFRPLHEPRYIFIFYKSIGENIE
jgi:hypothetical protein